MTYTVRISYLHPFEGAYVPMSISFSFETATDEKAYFELFALLKAFWDRGEPITGVYLEKLG